MSVAFCAGCCAVARVLDPPATGPSWEPLTDLFEALWIAGWTVDPGAAPAAGDPGETVHAWLDHPALCAPLAVWPLGPGSGVAVPCGLGNAGLGVVAPGVFGWDALTWPPAVAGPGSGRVCLPDLDLDFPVPSASAGHARVAGPASDAVAVALLGPACRTRKEAVPRHHVHRPRRSERRGPGIAARQHRSIAEKERTHGS